MSDAQYTARSPRPTEHGDPFTDPSYAVPLTPAAPRPPFAQYQSASTLPRTYQSPSPHPSSSNPPRSGLNEYISLPTRLLLASLSPALLPIILTIAHLSTNRRSTADMADSLRSSMYAACTGLAQGAGTLQTIPRYMAMQTNEQMVRVTQGMIRATGMGLIHMVTIIETVVIFVINTYRSLLVCTIELAVRGTLELMIGAVRGITQAVTASLDEIRSAIQSSVSGANNVIQEAVSRLSRATSLIGIDISIPEFTIPELSRLSNVTIPNDFEQSLVRLNSSIPSLDELRSKLDSIISQPFSLLKTEMNTTRLELADNFNSSLLPTPPLSALSAQNAHEMEQALCGDLDTSLVDDTAKALGKLSSIAIGLMCLLLFLCWAALCAWEWYRWKCLKDSVETVQDEWRAEGRPDAWRAVAVIENPVLEKYGSPALRRLARKERTRRNVRWYLSYLSHPTTLTLLLISLLCLIALQLQLVALNALKSHAQSNADAAVNASTASLTSKLNDMAMAQSRQYAADYSDVVRRYQADMDERLIGHWVNTTGVALNSTLNEFYDDVENIIDKAFGNTVLHGPMSTFMYCILGSKIDSLSRALTWLRDNARIELPLVPDNILMLSPDAMNELAGPITAAAVGSSPSRQSAQAGQEEAEDGIVGKLIGHWEKAIRAEMVVYAILVGVWGALALVGLVVVLWNSGPGDRFRSRRENGTGGAGVGEGYGHGYIEGDEKSSHAYQGTGEKAPIHQQYASRDPDNVANSRPSPKRSSTGLSRLASLVGPADRFLRFGRQTPAPGTASELEADSDYPYMKTGASNGAGVGAGGGKDGDKERLVLGDTSERYNSSPNPTSQDRTAVSIQRHDSSYPYYNYNHHTITALTNTSFADNRAVRDSQIESPPAFWIKRAADAAMSPVRSFFPTSNNSAGAVGGGGVYGSRGEKHGRAIHLRGAEGEGDYERMRESEESARLQAHPERSEVGQDGRYDDAPLSAGAVGVALGGQEYGYEPSPAPSSYGRHHRRQHSNGNNNLTFPRPMSRASTHYDGRDLQPWQMGTPPVPVPKQSSHKDTKTGQKHDSVDMLDDAEGNDREGRVEGWLKSGAGHVDPFADADGGARVRVEGVNGKVKVRGKNPFADMGRI